MTAPHETRAGGAPDEARAPETGERTPDARPGSSVTAAPQPSTGLRGRRRRPTGAPPPLPRSLGTTGKIWLAALAVLTGWVLVLLVSPTARRVTDQADAAVLRRVAELRTAWLTDVATAFDRIATGWTLTALAVGVIVLQIAFRRWRHLFTFLLSILVMEEIGILLYDAFSRPRPYDVTTIGRWAGFSSPSPPVVVLAAVLVAVIYSLVPAGPARGRAKLVVAAVLLAFVSARLYLGVDHPFDALAGLALGIAIPLAAFRLFTPNDVVPVAYRQGKTAHLDVTGRRGEAIRQALHDQLGITVTDVRPVGLEGSGGSTPLRLRVEGDPEHEYLFAKAFAMNHVRADRWYKLGRQILYGRLEDETRFSNVRRLVEYEDYALRLLRDAGIPTATPYGIVEVTPEREYVLVTSFIDGAVEIGDAEVDDSVIDDGLQLVRRLWNAGLAHRDIKPANLLVRDGHVFLIDAFFVQVRPSPWRQAVDLGNMMLALAVRSDPERVYRRALRYFTAGRHRRGVRRLPRRRQPHPAPGHDAQGRPRPDRPVPAPGARAAAHRAAALELPPRRPGGRGRDRRLRRRRPGGGDVRPRARPAGEQRAARLRHRPDDGADGPVRPVGHAGALRGVAACGLGARRCPRRTPRGALLARLGPRRRPGRHRHARCPGANATWQTPRPSPATRWGPSATSGRIGCTPTCGRPASTCSPEAA